MENMFASEGVTKSDRRLHTPGVFAKNNLLYVQEVGKLRSLVPHVCKREGLNSYLIFVVLKGKGSITFQEKKTELYKGECIWIDCQYPFEHISSGEEPWQLAWVHFNGKCAQEFYDLFLEKNASPAFMPSDSVKIAGLIEKVLECVKEDASELEIHSILTQMVVECIQTTGGKDKIKEVQEYINANYKEGRLVVLLSERFGISQSELAELFMASYGIGLEEYILNRRFNAAKELLRFTIEPIEDVIRASGIGNKELFYRLFQENEAMSPEDYRKNWAQWIKD